MNREVGGNMKLYHLGFIVIIVNIMSINAQVTPPPTTINDFFLPGSQPGQSGNMEMPKRCDNCHGGYDLAVEPVFNWRGSMMAQAARDPLYLATLSIANQDAPQSGDLCIRCHSPGGWLEGRSEPTSGSALTADDRESVQCDFCHRSVAPSEPGVNPYPDDTYYTNNTYVRDSTYLSVLDSIPPSSANGMYIVDSDGSKRGPYSDINPNHQWYYSPFHSSSDICGTCHDVSNPVFYRVEGRTYAANSFDTQADDFDPYSLFPVERTFSEWKMSAYNTPQGISGTMFGGNKSYVSTCQDCHMQDVTGQGCNKNPPIRDDLPLHDMTGGNTFVPTLIELTYPGEADLDALDAGITRATTMLQLAASMELTVIGNQISVKVTNETGHKLPSGYPEGRRIWLNIRAYDSSDNLVYESGAYDSTTGVLTQDDDIKVYEIKPGISDRLSSVVNLPAGPSFHFVLNDTIYSDNRIPPRGFTNDNFESIQSPPVDYTYEDGQYWDETNYSLVSSPSLVEAILYYQTTSKEYVEFLRDENSTDDWGQTIYDMWDQNGKSAPVVMASETWTDIPSEIKIADQGYNLPNQDNLKIQGPNPFNSQISFIYQLAQPGYTEISVFDISGKKIQTLVNRYHNQGNFSLNWNADNLSSGSYFIIMTSSMKSQTRKVLLIK